MVKKADRDDYEEGGRDRDRNIIEQAVIDNTRRYPDTPAYWKGRNGEQLDGDKKNN